MRFMVDENVPLDLAAMLREEGHDVTSVSRHGIHDDEVLAEAEGDQRVLVTLDKDFGEIVFLRKGLAAGVILLRLPRLNVSEQVALVRQLLPELIQAAPGSFVVMTRDRIRIRSLR